MNAPVSVRPAQCGIWTRTLHFCSCQCTGRPRYVQAIEAGKLPTTSLLLAHPKPRLVGDPTWIRPRPTTDMPHPFAGKLGDFVSRNFTPRTIAAYGSCGPRPPAGVEVFEAREIVIAVIALSNVLVSGRATVFSDRLPMRQDAEMFDGPRLELVPYPVIQTSQFMGGVDPSDRLRYNCELLFKGALHIALGVEFAVPDQATADALTQAVKGWAAITPLVRPSWYFKR
jgi:hypothetical protein